MSSPYKAYAQASGTVSKVRQVVMLCEGMVRFMQQGIDAFTSADSQLYQEKLSRVGEIVLALKAALDVSDPIGRALDTQYHSIDRQILFVQHQPNMAKCQSILGELRSLRDMWDGIAANQSQK